MFPDKVGPDMPLNFNFQFNLKSITSVTINYGSLSAVLENMNHIHIQESMWQMCDTIVIIPNIFGYRCPLATNYFLYHCQMLNLAKIHLKIRQAAYCLVQIL